jgi:proteasome lid subunit RPN8/RPN11
MEILRESGEAIAHARIEPDWQPAIEWTRLTGLRARDVWASVPESDRLEPLWHADLGEPYVRGFRVRLADRGGTEWHHDFSVRYFAGLARAVVAQLVEKGTLTVDDAFMFRTLAYAQPRPEAPAAAPAFKAVDHSPALTIRPASRQTLQATSIPASAAMAARDGASIHEADGHADDFEVFVPQHVLDEASTLTRAAGDLETGGVLIGHLSRDSSWDGSHGAFEIFIEITAVIPAHHTLGTTTKLTFTSDTWTDVRHAVALRRQQEMVLGWFHSHPQHAWCRAKGCALDDQLRCRSADGFFSSDDVALHRTMFPQAFTVGLLMTNSAKGITPRCFGWRSGAIEPRGYRVLTARGQHIEEPNVAVGGSRS